MDRLNRVPARYRQSSRDRGLTPRVAPRRRMGSAPGSVDRGEVLLVILLYVLGWLPGLVANLWLWSRDRARHASNSGRWGAVLLWANACWIGLLAILSTGLALST
jgi:hypothetical protein